MKVALAAALRPWIGIALSTSAALAQPTLRTAVVTVEVDVIVTDRDGRPVSDLRAQDFELLQDDRAQPVTTFAYVPVTASVEAEPQTGTGTAPPTASHDPVSAAAAPGRLLVVVVDDLTLSPESMLRTRTALAQIVDEQLQAGDRMAIVRTSGGGGSSQAFSADRAVLRERVDRLRFNARQFERDDYKVTAENELLREWPPVRNNLSEAEKSPPPAEVDARLASTANEDQRAVSEAFSAGVLGTLQGVVEGLRALPGRKGVLLFSDGFTLTGTTGGGVQPMLQHALNRLVDQALRAHAVIYAINVRPWEAMSGADRDLGGSPFRSSVDGQAQLDRVDALRTASFSQMTEGPAYLAAQTGGFFFRNPPDLALVTRRSLDDQRGYYLLGYTPDAATIEQDRRGRTFHRLTVRLRRRAGLTVRSRKGFLGGPDADGAAAGSSLANAAASPFAASALDLRLTGFFAGRDGSQSVVRTLVYVDAAGLEFQRSGTGTLTETFLEVLTVLLDERGTVVKRDQQSYRMRSGGTTDARGGFVYRLDVLVKQPGPYHVRVAAREVGSNKVGAASQFVIVPDLTRRRLTLSGVLLSGSDDAADASGIAVGLAHPAVRRLTTPVDSRLCVPDLQRRLRPATEGARLARASAPPARRPRRLHRTAGRCEEPGGRGHAGQRGRFPVARAANQPGRVHARGDRRRRPRQSRRRRRHVDHRFHDRTLRV